MREYNKKDFIINMLIMSSSMLVMRIISMIFNIYFTSVIGAEKTGLFHIIFSVYGFMITFSISGISLAVTRLVAEGKTNRSQRETGILKKCGFLCLGTSSVATATVFSFAEKISIFICGSTQGSLSLKILATSLIPLSLSAVIRGYFMAVRKSPFVTLSQLAEETASVFITIFVLEKTKNSPYAYMSMICGISSATYLALFLDFILYYTYTKNLKPTKNTYAGYKDILSISVPVALGSYLRSALLSAENILIPKRLALWGENSLAKYGVIKGMSLPVMLFPTFFISAFSSLLLPEVANRHSQGAKNGVRHMAKISLQYTLIFSLIVAFVLYVFHDYIGNVFYKNKVAGIYLGYLALLCVPMYIDTVVDTMLKGLNQQMMSLLFNIADSVMRLVLIWYVVPRLGEKGYIAILYISELFNLFLSFSRLVYVTRKRKQKSFQKSGKMDFNVV